MRWKIVTGGAFAALMMVAPATLQAAPATDSTHVSQAHEVTDFSSRHRRYHRRYVRRYYQPYYAPYAYYPRSYYGRPYYGRPYYGPGISFGFGF